MKPYPMHQAVHDKGSTGEIATVLKKGEGKEQQEYRGDEHQHRAQPAENPIADK